MSLKHTTLRRVVAAGLAVAAAGLTLAAGPLVPGAQAKADVRKDVMDLTADERRDYVEAVLALKRTPSPHPEFGKNLSYYDLFVQWHRDVFFCNQWTAHLSPTFLPWHRYYLRTFERALRKVSGKRIALPYWDWTDPESVKAVFRDDFMGGNGSAKDGYAVATGPFRKGRWRFEVVDQKQADPFRLRFLTRRLGKFGSTTTLPTRRQVDSALDVRIFDGPPFDDQLAPSDSFRNNLEGWRDNTGEDCENGLITPLHEKRKVPHEMHNRVHLWVAGLGATLPGKKNLGPVAGTMANNTSPNDPVFFIHHANIDRIWQSWIERHGRRYSPKAGFREGQNLNDPMGPFDRIDRNSNVTPASQLNIGRLGYRYSRLPGGSSSMTAPTATGTEAIAPPSLRMNCRIR